MSIKASSVATNERVRVDFLSLGEDCVEDSYGYYYDGGKILCMIGYTQYKFRFHVYNAVKMIYNSFLDRVLFLCSDGTVLVWGDSRNEKITLAGVAGKPQYFLDCYYDDNYYPALLCGNKLYIFNDDGTIETRNHITNTYCCAYHHGRIFDVILGDEYEFCWTVQGMTSYEADDIGKGGFMCVPKGAGPIKRLYSLGDRIVILRDFGINVMRGLADTRNFSLEPNTVMLSEKLIENTAHCTGKKVWFCTQNFLYCFDGTTLTQTEHGYGGDGKSVTCLDVIDERYVYLSVNDGTDCYLLKYDPITGKFIKFAKSSMFICKTPRGLFTLDSTFTLETLKKKAKYGNLMKFKTIDFGNEKYKTLKSIRLKAEQNVKLNVAIKDAEYSFVPGEYNNLNITARSFDFSLAGSGDVSGLEAVWEVYK